MAKIFIYIFSFLLATSLSSDSISKKELRELRKDCIQFYKERKYSELIPMLEKYLSFREDITIKTYLAKSILFNNDLPVPKEEDEIFLRQKKIEDCLENYSKSAKIFSELIPYLEKVTPKDKSLGELYFLWAFSEYFSANKEKSISLFQKSAKINPELKSMAYYNIAALYEDLGQKRDSEIYFRKKANEYE